jgi:hypothetical protein
MRSKDLMYSIFSESIGEIGSDIQNVELKGKIAK